MQDFEKHVQKYHRLVLHLIRKYYGGQLQADAEDLAQEIWSKLWVHFKKNENQVVNFKSYLYRTVQTTLWDSVRKLDKDPLNQGERVALGDLKLQATGSQPENAFLSRQIVANLINTLGEQDQVIIKAHMKGLNYRDIASLLDISEGRIRNLLTRIKKKMARSYHALESKRL